MSAIIQARVWALVAVLSMVACAGGDGGAATPTSAPAADPRAEVEWLRGLCTAYQAAYRGPAPPPLSPAERAAMSLAERRERALAVWPEVLARNEDFLRRLQALSQPPERIDAFYRAVLVAIEEATREMRRSLAEIDRIFVSVDAVEANNARLEESERRTLTEMRRRQLEVPSLVQTARSLRECDGTPFQ